MEKITIVLSVAFAMLMGTLSVGYNSISLQTASAQMMTDSNITNKNMSGTTGPGNDVRNERRECNGID